MVLIRYRQPDGAEAEVQTTAGTSVMEAAVSAGVEGIDADCGGQLSCATCHVYIDDAWRAKLKPKSADEEALLDCAVAPNESSRLCCQIVCTDELDGLVVQVPETQR